MSSLVAYYTAASAVIIALSIIFQVNGQPTVEVSEKGDSSNIVVEEIQQLRVELHVLGQLKEAVLSMKELINASSQQNLIRTQQDIHVDNRSSQEQVQSIHEVLNGFFLQMTTILQAVHIKQIQSVHELVNASFQELKNQQDAVVTSIQAADRCSREQDTKQIQSVHELFNASFQELKSQQDVVVTSIQAADRCSREQDNKQIQSVHALFNASFQELKSQQDVVVTSIQAADRCSREQETKQIQSVHELFNASFQELKSQQDVVVTSIQAADRCSREQDTKQIQSVHELFNASFQELKSQQDAVVTSIQAIDRRSQEQNIYITQIQSIHRLINETNLRGHDISIRNKTQIFWKRETAFATEVGEVPIFLSLENEWIVLMNRFGGSLNFNRSWTEYKNGFGDIGRGEFWLGNEKIHRLTNTHGVAYTLRIQIQPDASDQWYFADYDTFSIDSESNKYTLHLSGYRGNAGDSLTNPSFSSSYIIDEMKFSTFDNDNDNRNSGYENLNCAMRDGGGWWFNNCQTACLTGSYNVAHAFQWYSLRHLSDDLGKLRAARMMIKSK